MRSKIEKWTTSFYVNVALKKPAIGRFKKPAPEGVLYVNLPQGGLQNLRFPESVAKP
jgi:hypothetical protein